MYIIEGLGKAPVIPMENKLPIIVPMDRSDAIRKEDYLRLPNLKPTSSSLSSFSAAAAALRVGLALFAGCSSTGCVAGLFCVEALVDPRADAEPP